MAQMIDLKCQKHLLKSIDGTNHKNFNDSKGRKPLYIYHLGIIALLTFQSATKRISCQLSLHVTHPILAC